MRGLLAEVELRGGLEAEGVVPEGDAVQVLREELVFRGVRFEAQGPERFLQLAGEGALAREERAGELLRDGAAAGDDVACGEVLLRRAEDGGEGDAGVGEEAVVFGGEEGGAYVRGDLVGAQRGREGGADSPVGA